MGCQEVQKIPKPVPLPPPTTPPVSPYWLFRTAFRDDVPSGSSYSLQMVRSFLYENHCNSTDSRKIIKSVCKDRIARTSFNWQWPTNSVHMCFKSSWRKMAPGIYKLWTIPLSHKWASWMISSVLQKCHVIYEGRGRVKTAEDGLLPSSMLECNVCYNEWDASNAVDGPESQQQHIRNCQISQAMVKRIGTPRQWPVGQEVLTYGYKELNKWQCTVVSTQIGPLPMQYKWCLILFGAITNYQIQA